MSTDRETTRIVRSWLEEGVTRLPDNVLDMVLDQLPATSQRRVTWWPVRRLSHMNKALAFGVAAAVVVIVALLGIRFFMPAGSGFGGPDDQATPTPASSPTAWPLQGGDIAAGTYLSNGPSPLVSTITVPAGWVACGTGSQEFAACAGPGDPRAVTVLIVDNLVSDPCDRARALLDPPVGDSVDDLVTALSNLADFEATDPVEITLDGFRGQQFELTAPTDPGCVLDDNGLGTWTIPGGTNGVGPGEINVIRIIDVDGVRAMVSAAYQPYATADEIAEVRAIFESVRVAP